MLKKFLSVFLCVIVFTGNIIFTPYLSVVYGSDAVTNIVKNISYDYIVKFFKSLYSVGYGIATNGSGDNGAVSSSLDSIWGENSPVNKWMQTKLFPFMDANRNVDLTKPDCPITYDKEKQLVNFNPTFTKELGEQVQSQVHALDGYYLVEPSYSKADLPSKIYGYDKFSDSDKQYLQQVFNSYDSILMNKEDFNISTSFNLRCLSLSDICYIYSGSFAGSTTAISTNVTDDKDYKGCVYVGLICIRSYKVDEKINPNSTAALDFTSFQKGDTVVFGAPFKVFYSYNDAQKYLNNDKQRTYAPQLPSTTISIPIKYINNTTNLPDLSFNLDSLIGKAEADIQAGLDAQLKIYLDKLADVNINPDKPINPTPTPDGGFTDGATPTPKPDFGDDSNPTDTNDWLKKIYEWLQSFGDTHSKFEQTITDYIEANDGKLDQIIEAINALSDGKTEDEKNGCKYDFTALSDFMTKLWNESDKKFDKMVELLEENNKYQKKLVNSLNEIKAILVTQTIMDVFQDRSQQTAEKAKDKFPTSLPWDIALVVNAMSAEPEKPQFNLPIQIKSLNINEEIHVDLASGEWEKLAKTCRYLLSILFILLMIQLSRKLFSNGGDD